MAEALVQKVEQQVGKGQEVKQKEVNLRLRRVL